METLIFLVVTVLLIILASTRWHIHPFLSLLMAAIFMGIISGQNLSAVIDHITRGFGNTLQSIGIVIAFGSIIGTFLEKSGGAQTLAGAVLQRVGEKRAPLAMNITGLIVSIPVFCDSGFIILSSLNHALSRRTGLSLTVFAVALATGLYATHVFVPPTPGPLAAAATLQANISLIILLGLIVAVPSAAVGWLWANYYCRKIPLLPEKNETENQTSVEQKPSAIKSLWPIFIPLILIALKSVAELPSAPVGKGPLAEGIVFVGHPVLALLVGVFFSFSLKGSRNRKVLVEWVSKGLRDAGVIILITGAGGALGQVLRETDLGNTLGQTFGHWSLSIVLPFIIAAILKTAQGSSTVAIITTAALVAPLLEQLGLNSEIGRVLAVLAIGAGSMTVSHLNDSYFWVVAQFSRMDSTTALRTLTIATFLQGAVAILMITILATILI